MRGTYSASFKRREPCLASKREKPVKLTLPKEIML